MKGFIVLSAIALAGASLAQSCCDQKKSAEAQFMALAQEMQMNAEGKKACCKSTAEKPVAKAEGACCNATGAQAKFKVFVAGEGYKYFGCPDSAAQGRKALATKGAKVGKVQPVSGRVAI